MCTGNHFHCYSCAKPRHGALQGRTVCARPALSRQWSPAGERRSRLTLTLALALNPHPDPDLARSRHCLQVLGQLLARQCMVLAFRRDALHRHCHAALHLGRGLCRDALCEEARRARLQQTEQMRASTCEAAQAGQLFQQRTALCGEPDEGADCCKCNQMSATRRQGLRCASQAMTCVQGAPRLRDGANGARQATRHTRHRPARQPNWKPLRFVIVCQLRPPCVVA